MGPAPPDDGEIELAVSKPRDPRGGAVTHRYTTDASPIVGAGPASRRSSGWSAKDRILRPSPSNDTAQARDGRYDHLRTGSKRRDERGRTVRGGVEDEGIRSPRDHGGVLTGFTSIVRWTSGHSGRRMVFDADAIDRFVSSTV